MLKGRTVLPKTLGARSAAFLHIQEELLWSALHPAPHPFPSAISSLIHSLWAAETRRWRHFFSWSSHLSSRAALSQVRILTSGVENTEMIPVGFGFSSLWSMTFCHANTPTHLFILHKSEGWGSSDWLFGVFKCMTNDTESKQKNVFGTGSPLTRATIINDDSCCILFCFFFLLLKVRRCVKLNAPDNGYIKCSGDGNNYGATCEFSCIGGYELQGSPARVCQYNLGWSGVEPTCARKWVFHRFTRRNLVQWFLGQWEFGKGVWGGIQLQCIRGRKLTIFVSSASLHLQLKPLPPLLFPRVCFSSKLSSKYHVLESFQCAS